MVIEVQGSIPCWLVAWSKDEFFLPVPKTRGFASSLSPYLCAVTFPLFSLSIAMSAICNFAVRLGHQTQVAPIPNLLGLLHILILSRCSTCSILFQLFQVLHVLNFHFFFVISQCASFSAPQLSKLSLLFQTVYEVGHQVLSASLTSWSRFEAGFVIKWAPLLKCWLVGAVVACTGS